MIRLSARAAAARPSAVREILKVAERPEVVSFAGGLPAPELFPAAELATAFARELSDSPAAALQYGVTEGFLPLREWLATRLRARGIPSSPEHLLVVSGSQQGIDLVARVLLEPGDTVLVENPTYLAALQAFAAHGVNVVGLPGDEEGLDVDELEAFLASHRPALVYLVPDFQNPRGTSLSAARRERLAAVARAAEVPVLEDDPYGALRFAGQAAPPLAALADGLVVHLGTFSKTLAPGLRLGWVHAPPPVVRALTVAKQAADLQTATLSQRAVARLLQTFDYDAHLARLRAVYGERCRAMHAALEATMPPGTRWSRPEGGLFLWLELPPGVRDEDVFRAALAQGVAVVPGSGFFVGAAEHRFLRLNFSNQGVDRIADGIWRLGAAIERCRPTGQGAALAADR